MQEKLLSILGCPACHNELISCPKKMMNENIITGDLKCNACDRSYPIINGIPRFVPLTNYSGSFGFQWNLFNKTQVDTHSNLALSYDRFTKETKWNLEKARGEWILDGGCGNGRFLEVASRCEADVVGIDLSNAVDAASALFGDRKNVHLVQGSLLQLPFKSGVFDKTYCIGVIQHTPDPEKVVRELPRVVKQNGELALTIYERKKYSLFNAKYLLRNITKRMNHKVLLFLIRFFAPVLFLSTEILFRIPVLGRVFTFMIPFANYVHEPQLGTNIKKRYEWAIMDTFDMLSPQYDSPQTQSDVERYLKEENMVDICRLANGGLNIVSKKCR